MDNDELACDIRRKRAVLTNSAFGIIVFSVWTALKSIIISFAAPESVANALFDYFSLRIGEDAGWTVLWIAIVVAEIALDVLICIYSIRTAKHKDHVPMALIILVGVCLTYFTAYFVLEAIVVVRAFSFSTLGSLIMDGFFLQVIAFLFVNCIILRRELRRKMVEVGQ